MSSIQTVTGRIDATQLKAAYVHEHLYTLATPEVVAENASMELSDLHKIRQDLELFKQAGGNLIVEVTTVDYGRDLTKLRVLSEMSGVYIVGTAGFNKGTYNRSFLENRTAEDVAKELIAEIQTGIDGVKPGILKIGTSKDSIQPWELTGLHAISIAHLATGIPITTHTQNGTMANEQLDLFVSFGVKPSSVILGHMDQNPDFEQHEKLIDRGAFLGYDSIPKTKYDTKERAIDFIIRFARLNKHTHILLSGDFARQSYFKGFGGKPGLDCLLVEFKPELRNRLIEANLDADRILEDLFTHNPRRALALREVTP